MAGPKQLGGRAGLWSGTVSRRRVTRCLCKVNECDCFTSLCFGPTRDRGQVSQRENLPQGSTELDRSLDKHLQGQRAAGMQRKRKAEIGSLEG